MPKAKKKLQKKLTEVSATIDQAAREPAEKEVKDEDIFFVDTQGNFESRKSVKRRKLAELRAKGGDPDLEPEPKRQNTGKPKAPANPADPSYNLWDGAPAITTQSKILQHVREKATEAAKKKPLVPHAGTSIHPDEESRLELVRMAGKAYLAELKEQGRRPKPEGLQLPSTSTTEATTETTETADDTPNASEDEDEDAGATKPKNDGKRLTQAERNRKRKRKLQESEKAAKKRDRERKQKLAQRAKVEREQKLERERKAAQGIVDEPEQTDEVPRLGRHKFKPAFPDVLVGDEVERKSLLEIKPSSMIVTDQYKRFEAQRFIEPKPVENRRKPHQQLTRFITQNKDKKWDEITGDKAEIFINPRKASLLREADEILAAAATATDSAAAKGGAAAPVRGAPQIKLNPKRKQSRKQRTKRGLLSGPAAAEYAEQETAELNLEDVGGNDE